MLTVSFDLPLNNGGDTVSKFRVEWDTVSGFNGVAPYPNEGSAHLDAQTYRSYTIQYLTAGQRYFVRVSAVNSAGPGAFALTSPSSAAPVAQVPGKPHTIVAVSRSVSGSIALTWQRPRVPWHGIPALACSHRPTSEYAVGYTDLSDFSGLDNNNSTGFATTANAYTLTGLTSGKLYYIRVLARNPRLSRREHSAALA